MASLALSLAVAQAAPAAAQQRTVSVRLQPVAGSEVAGKATLTSVGERTKVSLTLRGLAPGSSVRSLLHAGTLARPSASAALLAARRASAAGTASAKGFVLFQGRRDVPLTVLADGDHLIRVLSQGRLVAYGKIPRLPS